MDPAQLVPPKPPPPQIIMNYPFAVTAIALFGVCGVLGILYFHPAADNTQLIVTLLGFLGLAFGQLVNNIKTDSAVQKTEETHLLVNSQMAELKKTIAELERAKGVIEGAAQEKASNKEKLSEVRSGMAEAAFVEQIEQARITNEAKKALDITKKEREERTPSPQIVPPIPAAAVAEDAAQVVRSAAQIAADIVAETAKQVAANLSTAGPVPVAVMEVGEKVAEQIAGHVVSDNIQEKNEQEKELAAKHVDEEKTK